MTMNYSNNSDKVETSRFSDNDPDFFIGNQKYQRKDARQLFNRSTEQRKLDVPPIALQMPDGTIFTTAERPVLTVGRLDLKMDIDPSLDLTPYNGHTSGVSRIHAKIVYVHDSFHVIDLESANGTYINGARITPHQPVPLLHGDVISFGYLDVTVMLEQTLLDDTQTA